MREPTPARVGLLGYGPAGAKLHAPLITTSPGLELAVISTSDPGRAAAAAAAHPGAAIVSTPAEAMATAGELDVVVLATPNATHVPLAAQAIDAGVRAVVVDKPLAPTAAEARAVWARAGEAGTVLTVSHQRRWDGDFLTVAGLLRAGALGEVRRFESRFERWRPHISSGWREHPGPGGAGGVLYDLGPHLIDQALVLFGPAESVYAEVDRRRPGAEVDDDTFVALTHVGGVRSHLWMSATAARLGPRFRVLGGRAGYVKYGLDSQEARLRAGELPGAGWGEEPPECWGTLGAGDDGEPVPTVAGAYPSFYAGLVRCLQGEGPPPVDPADAIAALEVIEAAQCSAASGTVVRLAG